MLVTKVPDSNRSEVDKIVWNNFDRTKCDREAAEGRMPGVILSPRPVHKIGHYEVAFFMPVTKVPDSNRSEVDKIVWNNFDRTKCDRESGVAWRYTRRL